MYADNHLYLSKYVTVADFTRSTNAIRYGIDNRLPIELLDNAKFICSMYDVVYDEFDGAIFISSGYRSTALNKKTSGSSTTSKHPKALAVDIEADVRKNPRINNKDIFTFCYHHFINRQLIWEFPDPLNPKIPAWTHLAWVDKHVTLKAIKVLNKKNQLETKYIPFSLSKVA